MKRKNFYKILLGCAALLPCTLHAQDVHFSQFYESAILRNPALTGVFSDNYEVGVLYRNQWSSISNPYQTGLVSFEAHKNINDHSNDFVSFGLAGYYDKAGSIDMQTTAVYPALSYNKSLGDKNNSFLSVGFTGGYVQSSFDPTKATFNNQYVNNKFSINNPSGEVFPNTSIHNWDVGAGVNFNSSAGDALTYVLGVSGYHFSQPNSSYFSNSAIREQMRWNVNAGVNYIISDVYSFQAQANYAEQGTYTEIMLGAMLGWNKQAPTNDAASPFGVYGGLYYRFQDAIIPTIKIKYQSYFFGVSYDVNVSTLRAASNLRGGAEISIFKTGVFKNMNEDRGKTLCPSNFF